MTTNHRTVASLLWTQRLAIAAITAGFALIGGLYVTMTTRPYESSALLLVKVNREYQLDKPIDPVAQTLRHDQNIRSQVAILETDDVVRRAIGRFSPEVLTPPDANSLTQLKMVQGLEPVWALLKGFHRQDEDVAMSDMAFAKVRKSLKVELQPNTDLIRVSFRHADPRVASAFVNEVIQSFMEKHLTLSGKVGVPYFVKQRRRFEEQYQTANAQLNSFAQERRIYQIEEQRKLILRRRSELASALSSTRTSAIEKHTQIDSITSQLAQLKPISQLPQLAQLPNVGSKSAGSRPAPDPRDASQVENRNDLLRNNPPLLLVRVYQDTVQQLVRANAELSGLRGQETSQNEELAKIDAELGLLSESEAKYEELRLNAQQAKEMMEAYAKRMASEQFDEDLRSAGLNDIQVAQSAVIPSFRTGPGRVVILASSSAAGLAFAVVMVLMYAGSSDRALRSRRPRLPAYS